MNREFKFRLWSKSENCFVNPNILEVWDESGKMTPFKFVKTGKLDPIYMPIENYVIQQFTGLKDKNGKEIYEGDIIRAMHDFGPAGFRPHISAVRWDKEVGYQWEYWDLSTIEIIGNIFETKNCFN